MKFFELLDELGIKFRLPEHAAVYTVEKTAIEV